MALMDFLNRVPTIISGALGDIQRNRGFEIQISAAEKQAEAFRQSASSTTQIANYNIELDKQALARELDTTYRQIRRLTGTQRTQMATTGASIGSKSFLSLTNATLDAAQRQILDAKNSQRILAQQRRYQAAQQAVDLENQARAAQYSAEVTKYNRKLARNEAISSGIKTLLGSIF